MISNATLRGGRVTSRKFQISNSNKGFTIVELIVAIAVLSFGIVAVYSAFSPFVELTYNISHRFTATYLAQEGLEVVRNIRDNNFINTLTWSEGLTGCITGCQADYKTGTLASTSANQLRAYEPNNFLKLNADGFYSYDVGSDTKFKRKITMSQELGTDTLKINVQVFWDYNGKPFSFETEEYLYNWH